MILNKQTIEYAIIPAQCNGNTRFRCLTSYLDLAVGFSRPALISYMKPGWMAGTLDHYLKPVALSFVSVPLQSVSWNDSSTAWYFNTTTSTYVGK